MHDLFARHPLLAAAAEAAPARRSLGELEFERMLEIIAAFSREIGLEALVTQLSRTLLELSGASGFALLLAGDGDGDGQRAGWRVRARMGLAGADAAAGSSRAALVFEDRPFESLEGDEGAGSGAAGIVPHRPIRFVLHSSELLVCDRPAESPQFAGDPYLQAHRPGAIVCLPLSAGTEPVGLVYLESALASRVFTPKALHAVQILSSQIGIALFNATLYERMERQVAQRTAALRTANRTLRETQAQLVATEKLAALGELTAGVAHELQNPLNFVNNFAEVTQDLVGELRSHVETAGLAEAGDLCRMVDGNLGKILANGKRTSAIVRSMLRHSQFRAGERVPTDLNALLKSRVAVLDHSVTNARLARFAPQARVAWRLDEGLEPIAMYAPEMSGVIDNLLHNALAALETRSAAAPDAFVPTLTLTTRRHAAGVQLLVHDNGIGIPAALQGKVFAPFFTTRPPGEGCGLGLSLAHDVVVKRHHGEIAIVSEAGGFTEVCVTLPCGPTPHAHAATGAEATCPTDP